MGTVRASISPRQLIGTTLLAWLSMLGIDFFLHAGLLSRLYLRPSPFLLPPSEAFRRIPLGYLSFLLLAVLLAWLMVRLQLAGWRAGLSYGLRLGGLAWGAFTLGLLSISSADGGLLLGWFAGQTAELAVAGAVVGSGLAGKRLSHLAAIVLAFVVLAVLLTIVLQSLGLAAAVRA